MIDRATKRGVPLVELRTTSEVRYVTDSAGWIAFYEPDLLDKEIWFGISSHGYEYPADGFGYRGVRLTPKSGASVTIEIQRVNIAERLYRITGEGIYRDSRLLGQPVLQKLPNGLVTGQDSVLMVPFKNQLHWFWGDTNRPSYPLGHFGTAHAVSAPTDNIDQSIALSYTIDPSGFSRPAFVFPKDKPGPVWVTGVTVISTENGEKLIAFYSRMKSLDVCVERGLAVFDPKTVQFTPIAEFDPTKPMPLSGHPLIHDGYLYGTRALPECDPQLCVRVRPTLAALSDAKNYEVFNGKTWEAKNTPQKLCLRDATTKQPVKPHGGSVFFNAHKKHWLMIVGESFGKSSNLGEIWLASANSLVGPWDLATKIVTHNKYDFYNPTQHPFFDRGRFLYFEGTYTNTFSGNPETTPRYNYNQILYQLDLDDPRLAIY
jgi:hypothetical protein